MKVGVVGNNLSLNLVCFEAHFCWTMAYLDVVYALRELTNFSIQWNLTNAHGTYHNGKWNGLVGLLAEGSADFGLNLLSITGE